MRVHERRVEFGWEGDNGLGPRLIQQIIAGKKTATCAPLCSYTEEELAAVYANQGEPMTVADAAGRPWCNIRVLDVFQTPFGNPDPRLVSGEGDGDDAEKFRRDHRREWASWLAAEGRTLTDETLLVAEVFELIDVAD